MIAPKVMLLVTFIETQLPSFLFYIALQLLRKLLRKLDINCTALKSVVPESRLYQKLLCPNTYLQIGGLFRLPNGVLDQIKYYTTTCNMLHILEQY